MLFRKKLNICYSSVSQLFWPGRERGWFHVSGEHMLVQMESACAWLIFAQIGMRTHSAISAAILNGSRPGIGLQTGGGWRL